MVTESTRLGYRQTEVGVIPEDWDLKPFNEISSMHGRIGWQGLKQTEFTMNAEEPYLITGMNFKDGEIEWDEVYHVSKERYDIARDIQLKPNDVLMTKDGTIGKVLIIESIPHPGKASLNSHLLVFRPIGDSYVPSFLYYQLASRLFRSQIELSKSGTTFFGISQESVGKFKIVLPRRQEQESIALVLSDTDRLINELDRLIEKKRNIKQGAMQELLTGKKRLPGFAKSETKEFKFTDVGVIPEEWKVENILDNSTLKARIGWQGLTTAEYLSSGMFHLVTGTDFSNGKIDWDTCVYVDERRYSQDRNIQLKASDILVTKDGTIGKIAYVNVLPLPATLNSGIFVIRPKGKAYFPLFLFYILSSSYFAQFLNKLAAGSTINHLYQKDFGGFSFVVPEYSEQERIAQVLSDMDSEIEALRQKRDKYKQLKMGMMQQLLTGRIRLKWKN